MKRIYVIVFIILLMMIIWQFWSIKNEYSILKESGKLATGHVLSFSGLSKFRKAVTYTFDVDGKSILEEREETKLDYKNFNLFEGKFVPVIYDPANPKVNHIILTKSDFILFNIAMPDSLKYLIDKTD